MNNTLTQQVTEQVRAALPTREITPPRYATMQYPRFLPMMRFSVHQYKVDGLGHFMTMDTRAMGGLMKLSTLVFTPGSGANVPFLLVDTMQMAKKRLAYVEYYDCTRDGAQLPKTDGQRGEFAALPDYAETPAWYVERRTPYSLIKGGDGADGAALDQMVLVCVERYLKGVAAAQKDPRNLEGLAHFQEEMLQKGNPSSGTLNKVLGKQGADEFFRTVIMPVHLKGE